MPAGQPGLVGLSVLKALAFVGGRVLLHPASTFETSQRLVGSAK